MRAHITLIPESVLEFGKNDTVVVTLIMNSTEARRIRESFHLDAIPAHENSAAASLDDILSAVEDGPGEIRKFNAVND